MSRLLIIGLDCATPQFVFDSWRGELPNLDRLMREGIWGELRSTVPPITVPAWTSMMASKDPGQLGFYGFRNRKSFRYEDLYIANASHIRDRLVWNDLDEAGLRSILIGIPQTFPPKPLNGIMVGCFLTPDRKADYTHPPWIKDDLDRIADGEYLLDVGNFRTDQKEELLQQIYTMTRRRFRVVRHYLQHEHWDFFMFVEMGIDRIHHGFWRYGDKGHRLYEAGGPYEGAILEYYRTIDREIGAVLDLLDSGTAVMVVSDHGAKRMEGAFCINDWLMRKGFLHLKAPVETSMRLTAELVDWERTKVWAEGGYCGRIFLNVKGREPMGVIPRGEYETFRDHLREELEGIEDDAGRTMGTRSFKPEEIYHAVNNIAPDLIVYFGDLNWRGAGTVGNSRVHLYENDTGPDDANHSEDGIWIFKPLLNRLIDAGFEPGERLTGLSIYDVAPTVLDHFGLAIPPDMIGESIWGGAQVKCSVQRHEKGIHPQGNGYSEEEERRIRRRLEDLGYL